MPSPSFLGPMGSGAVRRVQCPYCHKIQLLARKPTPSRGTCMNCRREFLVTQKGASALESKRK
jgi:DNA-directed RNA polymerase subunit RPC12/RpoP